MKGYKKVHIRDHQGNILFPETHADMVRETLDRRFVDNIEKILLNKLGANEDVVNMLFGNAEQLRNLSSQADAILRVVSTIPADLADVLNNVDQLSRLLPYQNELLSLLDREAIVYNSNGLPYEMKVDDSDPKNPKLVLVKVDEMLNQPQFYVKGDTWTVSPKAPLVKVVMKPSKISFDTSRKTILTYANGKGLPAINGAVLSNIVNGAQDEIVSSEGENIPQAYVSYDVADELFSIFAIKGLTSTIRDFQVEVLTQPMNAGRYVNTQMMLNENVVQPTREIMQQSDYSAASFQLGTWTTTITPDFIQGLLNKDNTIAMVSYGAKNSSISISKPSLVLWIANPYVGKTLVATKNMGSEFSIRDWAIQA